MAHLSACKVATDIPGPNAVIIQRDESWECGAEGPTIRAVYALGADGTVWRWRYDSSVEFVWGAVLTCVFLGFATGIIIGLVTFAQRMSRGVEAH